MVGSGVSADAVVVSTPAAVGSAAVGPAAAAGLAGAGLVGAGLGTTAEVGRAVGSTGSVGAAAAPAGTARPAPGPTGTADGTACISICNSTASTATQQLVVHLLQASGTHVGAAAHG
jgi:hypothetical protein